MLLNFTKPESWTDGRADMIIERWDLQGIIPTGNVIKLRDFVFRQEHFVGRQIKNWNWKSVPQERMVPNTITPNVPTERNVMNFIWLPTKYPAGAAFILLPYCDLDYVCKDKMSL